MAGTPDSDGVAGDTFGVGDYRFVTLSESSGSGTVELTEYLGNGAEAIIPSTATHPVSGTVYRVVSIGVNAFKEKSNLTSVTIPDSVESIGQSAFFSCTGMSSITIPDSVTSMESSVFFYCTELSSITIPGSMATIADFMFYNCTGLTSVTIPDSVTSIEKYAFCGCRSLTSVTIPDSVTSIENYTFFYCTKLTSVTIPDSVESIGKGAFEHCIELTSVTIPDSVESIDGYAFFECSSIERICFGSRVSSIGYAALGYYNGDGDTVKTEFYDEDGTILDSSDASAFCGRTFKGDIIEMTREDGHALTFEPDNGTGSWMKTHPSGASIAKPADPERTGYTFQYWMKEDGTEFDFENETMPDSNLTLKALWKVVPAGDEGNGYKIVAAVVIAVVCIAVLALLIVRMHAQKR